MARLREIDLLERKRECEQLRKQNGKLQESLRSYVQQPNENYDVSCHKSILAESKFNQQQTPKCASSKLNAALKLVKQCGEPSRPPFRPRLSLPGPAIRPTIP